MVDYEGRISEGAAGMPPEHRKAVIVETIHAIQIGAPVSKGLVTILLDPWPDLHCDATVRVGTGWITLLRKTWLALADMPETRILIVCPKGAVAQDHISLRFTTQGCHDHRLRADQISSVFASRLN
jgi:hypothetical protein